MAVNCTDESVFERHTEVVHIAAASYLAKRELGSEDILFIC